MKRLMATLTTLILLVGLTATTQAAYTLSWTITPTAATAFDGTVLDKVVMTLDAGEGKKVSAIDLGPGLTGTFYQEGMFGGGAPSLYTDLFGMPTPEVDTHLLVPSDPNLTLAAGTMAEANDLSGPTGSGLGWGTSFQAVFGIAGSAQVQVMDFMQCYVPTGTAVHYDMETPGGQWPEETPWLSRSVTPGIAYARVDTTATATLTVENVGEDGSQLYGHFPAASGEFGPGSTSKFGPLGIYESDSRQYTYTPTDYGSDTQSITVTSNGGDSVITLSGTCVGPVFDSSIAPDSTLDFDEVLPGTPESFYLDISNITTDENGGDDALTDLTLLDVSIGGADSDLFEIVGFATDTLVHKDDTLSLEQRYNGTGTPGLKNATLYVFTDEDAALGANGSSFSYSISADVVPEPGTITLLLCGLAGLTLRRRW